jgi:hypothetical protein
MVRIMTGLVDTMVSTVVPKTTAAAACTPHYYTRCNLQSRICLLPNFKWRERWYVSASCVDSRVNMVYSCDCKV